MKISPADNWALAFWDERDTAVRDAASADLIFKDPTAPAEYGIPAQIDTLDNFLKFFQSNSHGRRK